MLADQGQASRRGLGGLPITTRSPRQDRAAGEWGRGSGRNSLLLASSFPHGPGSSVIRRGREGGDCQALQGRGSQRPRPGVTTGLATRGAIERHGGPLEACGRRGRACPFMDGGCGARPSGAVVTMLLLTTWRAFFFFLLLRERINQMRGEKQRRGEGADVCVCASGPRSSPGPALPPPT